MINNALKFILGLDEKTIETIEMLLQKLGKTDEAEQHIQQLPEEVLHCILADIHKQTDGTIDDPEDPDNTNLAQYYNKHNTDGWNPEQDRKNSEIQQSALPNVTSAKDYPVTPQNESHKPTFLQYILEQYPQQTNNMQQPQQMATPAQIDSQLANIGGDGVTRVIDPITQRQIDKLEASGNHIAADQLRKRAMRTAKVVNGPKTPADALVASRKQQLSQAIQAAQKQRQMTQQKVNPVTNTNNVNSNQPIAPNTTQLPNQQGNQNAIR